MRGVAMNRPDHDPRTPCILFLSCIGATPKYFMQQSGDFRRQYRMIPYLFNNIDLLPDMLAAVENELQRSALLLYHEPDWLPYLGKYRERYDQFVEGIPAHVTRISLPQPGFTPFWPFHCGDPRNADMERPRNRYGMLPCFPYGDTYVLRLMKEGLPPDEVIARYLALDVSKEVDLDRLLRGALSMLERQDRTGLVKVADFIHGNFRSKMLFQTVNHANNRLMLYVANQVLQLLDCETVPTSVLETVTEIVERATPVHPSIARHFGVSYLNADTRYEVDEVKNSTFAEFIRDYVYYASGVLNYQDGLINHPTVPSDHPIRQATEEVEEMTEHADKEVVSGSPEYIAYRLFRHVASAERRTFDHKTRQEGESPADRKWILDTYAECIEAVRNHKSRLGR
jgi:polysaccharide biosynthesis acetyltransferase WcbI-like protein